ncbi:MAG: hypothetical protein C4558_02425 [Dehalococcoidia bacterium]|nr:MAG: hypothetical protein C4558_02425 [Dehalococcoidia bacterium]
MPEGDAAVAEPQVGAAPVESPGSQPDDSRLSEGLQGITDRLTERLDDRLDRIEGRLPAGPEPTDQDEIDALLDQLGLSEAEGEPDEEGLEPGEPGYELSPRQLAEVIDQMVENRMEQQAAPYMQQLAEYVESQEFGALEQRIPDLADEAVQKRVLDTAEQIAVKTQDKRWLDPFHIEFVYKALKYDELQAGPGTSGSGGDGLERPGNANPASSEAAPEDPGERIVRARGHSALRDAGLV